MVPMYLYCMYDFFRYFLSENAGSSVNFQIITEIARRKKFLSVGKSLLIFTKHAQGGFYIRCIFNTFIFAYILHIFYVLSVLCGIIMMVQCSIRMGGSK